MTPLPSLESVRCFTEVARHLNFRAAARVIALTPAAVGQRVALLEELLGHRLFSRTSRKVVLTGAGLAFLPRAHELLGMAAESVRAARGEGNLAPVELTLGTRHELGLSFVVPLLPVLRRSLPSLTLHLYFGSGPDLLGRTRLGELHCALGSMRSSDPLLDTVKLHDERYVLVAAPALLARRPLRTPEGAAEHTLIDTGPAAHLFSYLRDAPGGERFRFGRVLGMGTIAAIQALVLAGDGVAVLPEYLVRGDLRARRLARLFPRQPIHQESFRLFFRKDDPRRSLYEALGRELLRAPLR